MLLCFDGFAVSVSVFIGIILNRVSDHVTLNYKPSGLNRLGVYGVATVFIAKHLFRKTVRASILMLLIYISSRHIVLKRTVINQ